MRKNKILPEEADFSSAITLSVTPPPNNQPPTNILLLLHGLGDSHEPFTQLGIDLQLPNTACISIRGPQILPEELSRFHWGDDVIIDTSTEGLDPDGGFKRSTSMLLDEIIGEVLTKKCNYPYRDIYIFGYGQGGMLGLNVALACPNPLGAIISVGGPLPDAAPASSNPKCATPILITYGTQSRWVTQGAIGKLNQNFATIENPVYKRTSDTMPRSRDEMFPIMKLLASRLRTPAPLGMVEASDGD